jgi:SAM-dependent methyltransferase
MRVLNVLAPRFSRRRLALSILRDFAYQPSSLFGRLAAVNFRNDRVCRGLTMACNVCGTRGGMSYDFPDVNIRRAHGIGLLRETLRCKSCGATMRDRQIATGLLDTLATRTGMACESLRAWRQAGAPALRILDSDSFSPINRVLRGMSGYVHSQFHPGRKPGEVLADCSLNVDLERMPFSDASFDVVLTSDVMEHVADDDAAHHEIHRCLVPGGCYVCTVPFDPGRYGHRVLTLPAGPGGARIVLEHHVHGDPHDSNGIVAHRIYGRQLLDDLQAMGFQVRFETIDRPANGVFAGDLIVAVKEG